MQFRSSFVCSVITFPGANFPPLLHLVQLPLQFTRAVRHLARWQPFPSEAFALFPFFKPTTPVPMRVYSNIEKSRDFVCVCVCVDVLLLHVFGVICRHQEARRLHHRAFSLGLRVVLVLDLILGLDSLMAMLPTMLVVVVMVMRLGLWLSRCFSSIGAALGLLG